MSDNKDKTQPQPPQAKQLSKSDQVIAHFAKLREHLLGSNKVKDEKTGEEKLIKRFAGQPGYNPFMYIQQVMIPVEEKIANGTVTDAELDVALKIPLDIKPDGNAIKINQINLRDYIANNKAAGKTPKTLTS